MALLRGEEVSFSWEVDRSGVVVVGDKANGEKTHADAAVMINTASRTDAGFNMAYGKQHFYNDETQLSLPIDVVKKMKMHGLMMMKNGIGVRFCDRAKTPK
jgi:hypothetical protein